MRIRSFQMRHAGRRSTFHSVGLFAVFLLIFPPESLAAEWLSVEAAQAWPPALLFVTLMLATWITEDLTCITAGLLVTAGVLSFPAATLACLVGIFTGDLLLYLAGKYLGRPFLRRRPLRWLVKEADIDRSADWFEHRGTAVILLSRFVPGTRLPTYVAAGLLNMPIWKFCLIFLIAAALWTPLLVGLAVTLGHTLSRYLVLYENYALPVFLFAALTIWIFVKCAVPAFTHKGRRLLLSSWRRKTRWEFWPPWVFYPPLIPYILYLGLKHRGLAVFTAADPAMPAGGFVGESKVDILNGLTVGRDAVARYALVDASLSLGQRRDRIDGFMQEHQLVYPIVLKPNTGQRGAGVVVVRSAVARDRYLERATWDILVQEFAPGEEFGVFYYRYPHEEHGHILSITEKRFPSVVGDGRRSLESLILDDDRAVCMAQFFLRLHQERLYDVPAVGERVPLVELGTHCRGAVFVDGMWINGPELERAIDRISKGYEGFYFGRYDVRTRDVEAFRQGQNFKVVELNGVTSEATHIYEPGSSLVDAYRVLARQWRIAFEIGAANRARGHPPVTLRHLFTLIDAFERPEV